MGGFIQPEESLTEASNRILKELTGLEGIFLEQLKCFGDPNRDLIEELLELLIFHL